MTADAKGDAAFTMAELLVVMTILSVLLMLGISGAHEIKQRSRVTECLSALRQIGVATQLYVGDQGGRLPDTSHIRVAAGASHSWLNTLAGYLGPDFIGRCPARTQAGPTYAWNDLLAETTGEGLRVLALRSPSATLVVAETANTYNSEHFHFDGARTRVTYNQFKSEVGVERHGRSANYLFADGHVESLSSETIKQRLGATDSAFLKP